MKKRIAYILIIGMLLTGCKSDIVSEKIRLNANDFNISRKVTVINTRTDNILYENQGLISIEVKSGRLDVITSEGDDTYTKDIIGLSSDTVFIIEDLEGMVIK